jgi:biotin transporter BioY
MSRPPDDRYDDDYDRPPRRGDRYDDDFEIRRKNVSWIEQQFENTSMVVLVLFSLCCGVIALVFGIIGLATIQNPDTRQKALVVTIISAVMIVIGTIAQFARLAMEMR